MNVVESPLFNHANESAFSLPWSSRAGMSFQSFLALSSDSRSSSSSRSTDLSGPELQPTPIEDEASRKSNSRHKDRSRRLRRLFGWRKRIISHFHKIWKGPGVWVEIYQIHRLIVRTTALRTMVFPSECSTIQKLFFTLDFLGKPGLPKYKQYVSYCKLIALGIGMD